MYTNERWLDNKIIGISVSESDDLLNLGYGEEHLREFLMRLVRPILRAGANIAYGGHFKNSSITRDIIELISDEQRESTSNSGPQTGKLYNHSPWPYYADITKEDEADHIDVCHFIPISQELARIPADKLVSDLPNRRLESRVNGAIVLSTMRQFMTKGMLLKHKGYSEKVEPTYARILVGGKVNGYSGILPGVYEEALYCLEQRSPLFILGGYGGAGAKLAGYLCGDMNSREAMLEFKTASQSTMALTELEEQFDKYDLPEMARKPSQAHSDLTKLLNRCRNNLTTGLKNGLSPKENELLFDNTDTTEAAALIVRGLRQCVKRDNIAASRKKSAAKKKAAAKKKSTRKGKSS